MKRFAPLARFAPRGLEGISSSLKPSSSSLNPLSVASPMASASCAQEASKTTRGFAASSAPPQDPSTIEVRSDADVAKMIQTANSVPVIMQFTATWCGPCKKLNPLLKSAVDKAGGKVVLAKLDVDHPSVEKVAEKLQVTSVPALFALWQGDIVGQRVGLIPEAEISKWFQELEGLSKGNIADAEFTDTEPAAPPAQRGETQPVQPQGSQANAAAATPPVPAPPSDPAAAASEGLQAAHMLHWGLPSNEQQALVKKAATYLAEALKGVTDNALKAKVLAGLARVAALDLAQDTLAAASDLATEAEKIAPPGGPWEVQGAKAVVDIVTLHRELTGAAASDTVDAVKGRHVAAPKDAEAAYAFALRAFVVGRCEEAIDASLALCRRNREYREQAGKRLSLLFFDCLGPDNPLSKSGKKRLGAALNV